MAEWILPPLVLSPLRAHAESPAPLHKLSLDLEIWMGQAVLPGKPASRALFTPSGAWKTY